MKAIFLDIEATLIQSMDSPVEMNFAHKIFDFVRGKENVFIFSWALWDENDVEKFVNSHIFKWICENVGQTIPRERIISKHSLRDSFSNFIRTVDLNDFLDICQSKEWSFESFVRFDSRVSEFNQFIFFDDRVENKSMRIGPKEIWFVKAEEGM
jgi:hypothetical protein